MSRVDTSDVQRHLEDFKTRFNAAVMTFAEQGGAEMRTYAKEHARWTDRTGNARGRLDYDTEKIPNGVRIAIGHGVDYGKYLEYAHERRFEILDSTIKYVGSAKILPAFQNFLDRVRGF